MLYQPQSSGVTSCRKSVRTPRLWLTQESSRISWGRAEDLGRGVSERFQLEKQALQGLGSSISLESHPFAPGMCLVTAMSSSRRVDKTEPGQGSTQHSVTHDCHYHPLEHFTLARESFLNPQLVLTRRRKQVLFIALGSLEGSNSYC